MSRVNPTDVVPALVRVEALLGQASVIAEDLGHEKAFKLRLSLMLVDEADQLLTSVRDEMAISHAKSGTNIVPIRPGVRVIAHPTPPRD
jgi:hypothetical protein